MMHRLKSHPQLPFDCSGGSACPCPLLWNFSCFQEALRLQREEKFDFSCIHRSTFVSVTTLTEDWLMQSFSNVDLSIGGLLCVAKDSGEPTSFPWYMVNQSLFC